VLASLLTGCVRPPREAVFETKLSAPALQQAKRECAYEAEKATAAIKPGYAADEWRQIYVMCLSLKDVRYSER